MSTAKMVYNYLRVKTRAFVVTFRKLYFFHFFSSLNVVIGKNLIIRGGQGTKSIGNYLCIYDNVTIECHNPNSKLIIGNNCVLSFGVIISYKKQITIGDNVWIGEYSSVRDTTHRFSINSPIGLNEDMVASIHIGNNVWIGRNSIIMPGAVIGNNVIIGANSLVEGNVKSNSLYAGSPAIFKKMLAD
jgi:acetyltransferase-like isoleucine patch superfamily enzyme